MDFALPDSVGDERIALVGAALLGTVDAFQRLGGAPPDAVADGVGADGDAASLQNGKDAPDVSVDVDPEAEITCDWRDGDVW